MLSKVLVHGGKRAQISAPKLTSRHSDRGGFHGSDHTIQGGDLDRDLSALRTERARGKLPAVETLDAANAGVERQPSWPAPTTKLAGTGSCGCTVLVGAQFLAEIVG